MERGLVSTLLSLVAVTLSAAAIYVGSLRAADLTITPAEVAYLAQDRNGSAEVIVLPLTVSNAGAREGVVQALRLAVAPEGGAAERRYLASGRGAHPAQFEPFAPLSVPGSAATSASVLFYPLVPGAPRVDAAGTYRLTLSYRTAEGAERTLVVRRTLPYYSLPDLVNGGTIKMMPADAAGAGA